MHSIPAKNGPTRFIWREKMMRRSLQPQRLLKGFLQQLTPAQKYCKILISSWFEEMHKFSHGCNGLHTRFHGLRFVFMTLSEEITQL